MKLNTNDSFEAPTDYANSTLKLRDSQVFSKDGHLPICNSIQQKNEQDGLLSSSFQTQFNQQFDSRANRNALASSFD